jgi:hypothetical protein
MVTLVMSECRNVESSIAVYGTAADGVGVRSAH